MLETQEPGIERGVSGQLEPLRRLRGLYNDRFVNGQVAGRDQSFCTLHLSRPCYKPGGPDVTTVKGSISGAKLCKTPRRAAGLATSRVIALEVCQSGREMLSLLQERARNSEV